MGSLQSCVIPAAAPFIFVLCFAQQENNLNPVCKQIWAASACAGPRIWRAGKWYAEKLELSGSKPAGAEKELSTAYWLQSPTTPVQLFCFQTWADKCLQPCAPQVERRGTETQAFCLRGETRQLCATRKPQLFFPLPLFWWKPESLSAFTGQLECADRYRVLCDCLGCWFWYGRAPACLSQDIVLCASSRQLFKHWRGLSLENLVKKNRSKTTKKTHLKKTKTKPW